MIRTALLVAGFCLLTACTSANKVDLRYQPTGSVKQARQDASVSVGDFVDSRGETKTWIGVIRGGFGNHLKELDTDKPVSVVVQKAFQDGLKARGVNVDSPNAPYRIAGTVKELIGDQVVKREARVAIDVSVVDASNGSARFSRVYTGKIIEGSAMSMETGVFADVEDLRVVVENALKEAIDKALDDPELRAALQI